MPASTAIDNFLEQVPSSEEIRRRIAENLRQAKLLRQMLRFAEQRESVVEIHDQATGGRAQ
jgi:hypothetical protein